MAIKKTQRINCHKIENTTKGKSLYIFYTTNDEHWMYLRDSWAEVTDYKNHIESKNEKK